MRSPVSRTSSFGFRFFVRVEGALAWRGISTRF
jgi:hypothetical protein